jgi:hypothetical protein
MTRKHAGNARLLARGALAALGLRPPVVGFPSQGFVLHDVTVVNPGVDRKGRRSVTVKDPTVTDISSFESVAAGRQELKKFA